jgi:amino acid transporter
VVIQTLFLTSLFACVLAFHNVLARYLHAMAGSSVMPKALASVHDTFGSPHSASLAQTASAALLIAACALVGLDPVLQVFSWGSGIAVLGVLVLMALTCLAVLVFFHRNPGLDHRLWHTKIAPGLGLVGLTGLTGIVAINFPTLIGGDAPLAVALGAIVIVALAIGIGVALMLKRRSPHLYETVIDAIAG